MIYNYSKKYFSGRRESWAKAFSAIDESNGKGAKAFVGSYLNEGQKNT